MIPGTKSSLYVEEIFEFSDILYGTHIHVAHLLALRDSIIIHVAC